MGAEPQGAIEWWSDLTTEHVGRYGNLFIIVPHASPTPGVLLRVVHEVEAAAGAGAAPVVLLCLGAVGAVPDDEIRPLVTNTWRRLAACAATAVVVEGGGFLAAAQRAVVTAVLTVALRGQRPPVMHGVAVALQELRDRLPTGLDIEAIEREIVPRMDGSQAA